MHEDQTLYNQVTVQNIDNEDFIFKVNRERYIIHAGETRIFMKFMVRPMLKHLIDKILIKREPTGKLLRNQKLRDELAAQIVLKEEAYEKPRPLTDHELVDEINKEPELDRILAKNRSRLQKAEVPPAIPTPPVEMPPVVVPTTPVETITAKPTEPVETPSTEETFDQVEEEKKASEIPTREEMLAYAKNTLKLDITEPKTKKAWDAMTDQQLFVELSLDKEEDLTELGFKKK